MNAQAPTADSFETRIPSRLDRLPWSRWHWLVVLALGAVWILDGLEVTIVGAIGATLQKDATLGLSAGEIGAAGAIYIAGACAGALVFGHLTDRFGRKKLFMVTLGLYLLATVATAFAWSAWSFFLFRFATGMGIGGEYSAINSAIDELIPARVRGWVDLAINGSWWLGTAAGAALSLLLLDPNVLAVDVGWRVCFGLGAVLGLGILLTRRLVPESPRWLMTHGRKEEADEVVRSIERHVERESGEPLDEPERAIEIHPRGSVGFLTIARTLFRDYRGRTVLGLSLMSAQAFAYNAVFFTYAVVLTTFYGVDAARVGLYILPFAVGNFLGPLLLGRLFDVVGRRAMIAGSYGLAGAMLAVTGVLFQQGALSAFSQTVAWTVIFFFASAGASAAYLTVSEVFPLEIRAMAIAFFYAAATAIGGISGPLLFGFLVGTKSASMTLVGFLIGAVWLVAAAVVELFLGVDAERRSLEEVAQPLSAAGADEPTAAERHEVPVPPEPVWRPGSDRTMWSPRPAFSGLPGYEDTELDGEIEALRTAAADGPLGERELLRRAHARTWGPGRGHRALRAAVRRGALVRRGRTYAAARRTAS